MTIVTWHPHQRCMLIALQGLRCGWHMLWLLRYHHKNKSKEVISGICFGIGLGSSFPVQQFNKALRDSGTSTLQCGVGSSLSVDVSWFLDG